MAKNSGMKVSSEFGKLILIKLKERGMTQGDLASALEKSEGWMSQLLHGDIELTVSTLKEIARVLGVDPRSLIPIDEATQKKAFEDFIRQICRDEYQKITEEKSG